MIEVRGLSFEYDRTPVLHSLDLEVTRGEVVALVGPSGSGKTTLLYCLAGILRGWTGEVRIAGRSLAALDDQELSDLRSSTCGYVLQFGRLVPELTALENVMLPLRLLRVRRDEARQRALDMMERVGVAELAGSVSARLSGGEQQRVAVARALVHDPAVVFADEPTGALDSANTDRVMDCLVARARDLGAAVVLVTHERDVAARADRVVEMVDGTLRENLAHVGG